MKNEEDNEIEILRKKVDDYEKLHSILRVIYSSLNVDDILQSIIIEAIDLCNADQGSIILFDPASKNEAKTLVRNIKTEEEKLDHFLNNLLAGWVTEHKSSLITHDLTDIFKLEKIKQKYGNIISVMSIPLESKGSMLGVINLISSTPDHYFTEREENLLSILASQCAQFIVNARLHEELFSEADRLRKEIRDKYSFHGIIGNSPKMEAVFSLLERIIPTDGRVLLEGESGTGKERIARVLHYNGPRKDLPFVAVDCGAMPANLLESELFGYVRGAFTGAAQDKKGLFEEADGGTLFLDEITNMPIEVQSKFLRVIQEGEFRRLGTTQVSKVDVRIITAASNNLREQVSKGAFRQDLFYRINVINVILPPLRERKEDIIVLADHFLSRMSKKYDKHIKGFQPGVVVYFENYSFPGNVRELENIVERIVVLAPPDLEYVTEDILPMEIKDLYTEEEKINTNSNQKPKNIIEQFEKNKLLSALTKYNWNQSAAARELNINEKTVRYRMQKYRIKKT